MRRLFWMTGGLVLAALAATQCGYPSFDFSPLTSSTSGGMGGMVGTGGTGGGADVSSTASTGTTTSTTCRVTHDVEDCGAGNRCTIVDLTNGTTGCVAVASSPHQKYADCTKDSQCPAGTWCDLRTSVCMPFCEAPSDCAQGDCVPARNSGGKLIAQVCTADCNPTTALPCQDATNCVYDSMLGDFDCYKSAGHVEFDSCTASQDCGYGLICAFDPNTNSGTCVLWCHPAGSASSDDCFGGACGAFSDLTPTWMGSVYGYCK